MSDDGTVTAGTSDTEPGHPMRARELPASVGRFAIEGWLGAGASGVVMLAADPLLGRKVALKVLRRDDQPRARARFLREAQAMARVTHENIIVVHEVGSDGKQVFIAMELAAGGTLTRWQAGRSWREIAEAYLQAARGLRAAHSAGLVHRDFKPDNVLVGADGKLRVTDFGLVAAAEDREGASMDAQGVSLTQTGAVMGTPRYMAPEQHLGEAVDARADQFSFCVAIYEALYGRPPFAGDTYAALSASVLAGELEPPPHGTGVPPRLHAAIERGLRRRRDERHPSMSELIAALEQAMVPPKRRSRWRLAGVAAALVARAIAIVTVMVWRRDAERAREALIALKSSTTDIGAAAQRFDAAQQAYQAGRYDDAAIGFLDAYGAMRDPALLFNAAAAFQSKAKKGDAAACRQAIAFYRRYLAEAPEAPDRQKVERVITTLEAELARMTAMPDAGAP